MFNSNEKFLKDISESFERFGIKEESSERGAVKDTVRIHMADTIHDSSYIAIAKPKSEKKNAEKVWKDILEKDFIPASTDPKNKGDIPAAALIVPEEDIDLVESLLKSKGLRPTVYQIFPGYVVAGLKRADVGKLIDDYQNAESDNSQDKNHHEDMPSDKGEPENTNNDYFKNSGKDDPVKSGEIKGKEVRKPFSLASKVAAAALLGVGAGLVPFAAKTIIDKNKNAPPMSDQTNEVRQGAKKAGINPEKYFESLKEGSPADMELLKSIASNPALSKEYIDKLADSPVGIDALKNPSVDGYIVTQAAISPDEDKRAAAAQNPRTRPEDLFRLSSDPSAKVRAGLARNPAISTDIMKKLSSDEKSVKEALLENPSLTPDILDMITNNTQPDCDFVRKMMANPCITPDILRRNSVNADECIRLGVASNPGTPQSVLSDLGRDKNGQVAFNSYANPNMSASKLDALFPPGWSDKKGSPELDLLRKGALKNPKLRKNFMEEALAADPMGYAPYLAKNPSLPSRLADEINRIARGRKGLRDFMNDSAKLKTDEKFHNDLKTESGKYSGDVSIPLRKKLNADFANSVYDPARLASIISAINKGDSTADSPTATQGIGSLSKEDSGKISSLDMHGNAPIFFSKKGVSGAAGGGGGGGGNGGGSGGTGGDGKDDDKGEAALRAADDIVSDMMSDILPPVAKGVYGSSKPPARPSDPYGESDSSPWRGMDNSKDTLFNDGQPMDVMFKNACDRIDALQVLF